MKTWLKPVPMVILGLVGLCILPELIIRLAPYSDFLRGRVYQNFAFWPGLLVDWQPNYFGQPVLMFLTYGFLHAGLWHLLFNMMTLVSIGSPLVAELGQRRFAVLYILSQLGGAIGYAVLSTRPLPMVGASGALFGLAGALLWMRFRDDLETISVWDTIEDMFQPILMLILLNVVMFFAMDGQLAWETHLGGAIAGAAAMGVLWRQAKHRS